LTSNENSEINQTDINKANEKYASRCPGISETAVRDLAKRMSRFYEMRTESFQKPVVSNLCPSACLLIVTLDAIHSDWAS
jgi:hypothetical protein